MTTVQYFRSNHGCVAGVFIARNSNPFFKLLLLHKKDKFNSSPRGISSSSLFRACFKGHKKFGKGYISLETKTEKKLYKNFPKNLFLKVEGGILPSVELILLKIFRIFIFSRGKLKKFETTTFEIVGNTVRNEFIIKL